MPLKGSKGPYPYHEGKHLIMAARMLVRTDETGIHANAPACVIAGFVSSPGQWKLFDADWRAVLRSYRVDCFHGKIFFNRKKIRRKERNPYLNWSDRRADDFFEALLSVIDKRKIVPVGGAVDVPAFEALSYGEQCALVSYWKRRGVRKTSTPVPYHLAFRMMLVDAADHTDPATELHFLMARQEEYQQRAFEAYAGMKKSVEQHEARFKSFGVAEPIDQPSLQAADLMLGQWIDAWTTLRKGRKLNTKQHRVMKRLERRRPTSTFPFCGAPQMEELLTDMEGEFPGMRGRLQRVKPETGFRREDGFLVRP